MGVIQGNIRFFLTRGEGLGLFWVFGGKDFKRLELLICKYYVVGGWSPGGSGSFMRITQFPDLKLLSFKRPRLELELEV